MARQSYVLTRDHIRKIRQLKELDPTLTKREACSLLHVSLNTLNKAADAAGLRKELDGLFPGTGAKPTFTPKLSVSVRYRQPPLHSLETKWLTGNWRPGL